MAIWHCTSHGNDNNKRFWGRRPKDVAMWHCGTPKTRAVDDFGVETHQVTQQATRHLVVVSNQVPNAHLCLVQCIDEDNDGLRDATALLQLLQWLEEQHIKCLVQGRRLTHHLRRGEDRRLQIVWSYMVKQGIVGLKSVFSCYEPVDVLVVRHENVSALLLKNIPPLILSFHTGTTSA